MGLALLFDQYPPTDKPLHRKRLATPPGAGFGNDASAIGHFDIDTAAFPELGGIQTAPELPNPDFQLLDMTVSGAMEGNGSSTESDFAAFTFAAFRP